MKGRTLLVQVNYTLCMKCTLYITLPSTQDTWRWGGELTLESTTSHVIARHEIRALLHQLLFQGEAVFPCTCVSQCTWVDEKVLQGREKHREKQLLGVWRRQLKWNGSPLFSRSYVGIVLIYLNCTSLGGCSRGLVAGTRANSRSKKM